MPHCQQMERWPGYWGVRDHVSWENVVGTGLFWFEEWDFCVSIHCQMLRAVMWGLLCFPTGIFPQLHPHPCNHHDFVLYEYSLNSSLLTSLFQKFKHIVYSILILHGEVLENWDWYPSLYISNIHNSWRFLKSATLNHLSLHQWSVHHFGKHCFRGQPQDRWNEVTGEPDMDLFKGRAICPLSIQAQCPFLISCIRFNLSNIFAWGYEMGFISEDTRFFYSFCFPSYSTLYYSTWLILGSHKCLF